MSEAVNLRDVLYWAQNYGSAGSSDQRAVETFMECETREQVSPLRAQLYTISQGNCNKDTLDKIVGRNREVKHGSYEQWAKMMLLWMASYKA